MTEGIPARRTNRTIPLLLSISAILLAVDVGLNAYSTYATIQQNAIAEERAATYRARVEEAGELATRQQTLIVGLIEDYEDAAYGNESIERITEQQLIATEFTLRALQIIAIQNSQILELLAIAP